MGKRVFVTVGTTKFDKLIQTTSTRSFLDVVEKLGYTDVVYQTGADYSRETTHRTLKLRYEKYFRDFDEQIERAALVISHGGAGTCLEVLRKKKPLIVVVNDDLMDNHQMELAQRLQNDEYLVYATCDTLIATLCNKDMKSLKTYPSPRGNTFPDYLDHIMGYV